MDTVAWLLEGDPAVRWQVHRDLLGAPAAQVTAGRGLVATRGWGARLLAAQGPDGRWAGALYSPKWTSTTYTLLLLDRLGLERRHPQALTGCRVLWDAARWWGGGLNLAKTVREPETCITAMLVLLAHGFGYDDARVEGAVDWLVGEQLGDGGWNCDTARTGSAHGSFHTTISVLEALERVRVESVPTGSSRPDVEGALAAGREFLLAHRLFRSHRTGEVVDPAYLSFPFPPQWHYDVLRGLEHFREAGAARDERLSEAVERLRGAAGADGTWRRYRPWPGRQWFALESAGPSRWTTLRALRVLGWWDRPLVADS
ncbi:hypothetical protein [Nocardioides pacificus]